MKSTKTRERKNLKKDSYENLLDGIKIWAEYWRKNPHRFCVDWLGIHLYSFQMILLYMMNISNAFVFIASRGLGKSFLTAVFCCVRCILYPGTKIVIASGNKGQAARIITEKIEDLRRTHIMLDKEIEKITTNHDNVKCIFKNTSVISIVASNDGARSGRGNILIADEYRLIKETVINTVLKQFLTAPRRPGFMDLPEYEDYPVEPNKTIYLSSAFMKSHWAFERFMVIMNRFIKGEKKSFACCIPYICGLDHKIITQERIDEDRDEIGEFNFLMEYCAYWYGENENSFFKSSEINDCRVLKKAYYPLTDDEYRNEDIRKKKLKQMPKLPGEIRLIGCDIAVCSTTKKVSNDNSVFTLMRLLPDGDGYKREVVHIESYNGMDVDDQATRIKRLFTEFQADKMIIDAQGVGYSVLSSLGKSSYDKTIDEHYEPFIPYDSSTNVDIEFVEEGKQVIYVFKGYEQTNNLTITFLKNAFMSKKIRLLIDENEKKEDFEKDKKYHTDGEYKALKMLPFIQTSQCIFETLNLEYEVRPTGNIAIKEKSGHRKDRYSSLAYTNYLAQLIEDEEYRNKRNNKSPDFFMLFN